MKKGKPLEQRVPIKILGMIPARYQSSRFPGKILAPILGKSLIQRTYENARQCNYLHHLAIATDDHRILQHATSFGADVLMTSPECPTGTDRLVEALEGESRFKNAEIVVNIQGDEPCLDPTIIKKLVQLLEQDSEAVMSTAVVPSTNLEELSKRSIVKCVFDQNFNALYFSRALIPAGHAFNPTLPYYRHMGIYAFRRDFLTNYAKLPMTPLQKAEDLEQLKVLEHGYKIKVAVVDHFSIGVDVPEDIQKVEQWLQLCKKNSSS